MNPKVSIITPVYMAEDYLHSCIDSVLAQTYQNWELLLIDDGSYDKSGAICDEYAQKDSRIRVFHKVNGGVSSARNLGLEKATGEWVMFLDSDDWIENNMLSVVEDKEEFDFIQFGFKKVFNGSVKYYSKLPSQNIEINQEEYCNNLYYHSGICGYIIKRYIIISCNIRFPLHIRYGEDQDFILKTILHVNKIFISNYHYYNYNYNPNSAMNAKWEIKRINDFLATICDITRYAELKGINLTYIHKCISTKFVKSYIWQSIKIANCIKDVRKIKKNYDEFVKTCSTPNWNFDKYNNLFLMIFLYYIKKFGIKK